ncbi:MAG: cell division protein FtsK [Caldibacillus debilis]|uniref:Cell division protein FtsK n=1 Tax=Caldibacillus debilis TaxID=301148 RepID=A0A3E0JXI1_9BACI|nr:DNA translocase FtsK [Caldibacillus debilis]REJ24867.1 MAG: cell division protein FtsK [Caldibacillus debilis]
MAKRKRRRRTKKKLWKETLQFEAFGLLTLALSVITIASLGKVGAALKLFCRFLFGEWYILIPLGAAVLSISLVFRRSWPDFFRRQLIGVYFMTGAVLLLSHVGLFEKMAEDGAYRKTSVILNTWDLFFAELKGETSGYELGGGMAGAVLFSLFHFLFDSAGTRIIAWFSILVGAILLTGRSLSEDLQKVFGWIARFFKNTYTEARKDLSRLKKNRSKTERKKALPPAEKETEPEGEERVSEPIISNFLERTNREEESFRESPPTIARIPETADEDGGHPSDDLSGEPLNVAEVENEDYQLPPIHLLKPPRPVDQSSEYELVHANAAKLERTFQSFGVKARVTQVHIGPAVTKYEVHPDVGVKVSRIVSLTDDLALALAAKDIRIEAPIPGKSAIGIEVPNSEVATVSLREVLEESLDQSDSKLLIALGRDITGEAVFAELNKMPHLLVAGATGSGKSVCINGIITSILMRAKPHEVKMMLIDPKMVELNVYNGIPHLLAPVVTNPKKAAQALQKVVNEMERRYELFSHTGTRNIEGYNEYIRRKNLENGEQEPLLPYIIVIVDELADLMMVASSDVEEAITRLAQMARASGIHLILATQRPSVDVITGVIKANIPSRIAFAVSSHVDSRTILDMGGAEKLLGRGDMLFFPVGASKPIRVQGAFVSDEEVEEVVRFVISQQRARYQEEMIPDDPAEDGEEVDDELYEQAVQLVAEMQTASVSMLQRRFRIGYTRAARLIDEMERRGIVGPYEGSKPRAVLIPKPSEDDLKSS